MCEIERTWPARFVGIAFLFLSGLTPAHAFDGAKVLSEMGQLLRTQYFDPKLGVIAAERLQAQSATLLQQSDRLAFAAAATQFLQSATRDIHVRLLGQPDTIPETAGSPEQAAEMDRARNYGIASVSILPGNIGCLRLSGFARPGPETEQRFAQAFDLLQSTYGLIIDLRTSRGGFPDTEANLVGYVAGPAIELDTAIGRDGEKHPTTTPTTYSGQPYGTKRPVAVAVSSQTISAAEAVPYDLQALGRAKVYGERTRGGANPSRFFPLSDGFIALVPLARSVNPITHKNWDGTGVVPDKQVDASLAVEAARTDLIRELLKTEKNGARRAVLTAALSVPSPPT